MNFLRTQSLQRIADVLKLKLNGVLWKTQSNLNVVAGHGISFAQIEAKDVSTLTVSAGGSNGSIGYWGSFWDTTNQTIASTTTAYVIAIGNSDSNNDEVSVVSGNRLTVANAGAYRVGISIQLTNDQSQAHDAVLWVRKNGVDVADSASRVTVPSTHGGINGHLIVFVELAQKLAAGDYVQFVWHANNTGVKIETLPAGTTPVYPQIPSVIVTINQI